jgi:peptide/nickel transport system permease protein
MDATYVILRKCLRALLTLWIVVSLTFVVLRSAGDPAITILGTDATPATIAEFHHQWGLDRPLPVQYVVYFANILHGDFGASFLDGRPALTVVAERIPRTLQLSGLGLLLMLSIGIPAGVAAALNRGRALDRVIVAGAVMGHSVPSFFLAILLILLFSVRWRLLPSGGAVAAHTIIMPAITIAAGGTGVIARFTRAAMLDALRHACARPRLVEGGAHPCDAERGDPNGDDDRLPARRPGRRRGDHRDRVRLAGHRLADRYVSGATRSRGRAMHRVAGRQHHGVGQPDRRSAVRLARPAHARTGARGRMTTEARIITTPARAMIRRWPTLVVLAFVWIGLCIVAAALAPRLPVSYQTLDLRARLAPPVLFGGTWHHALGTDEVGHDVFSRLLASIRVSLSVALAGTLIGSTFGTTLGFLAAHFRGWVDDVVMMLADAQAAIPFIIVALTIIAFFGTSLALFVVVVGLYGWQTYARLARAMALSTTRRGYVRAVVALGARPMRVYLRHVLPNVAGVLIVNATIGFPEVILLETALSFLGLGIQPPLSSLGSMLSYGRSYLDSAWWIAVLPGIVLSLCTLSVSLIGDWVRDRLDPTLR